uniref:hypothetical protein n=1 Tax=Mycobacterium tuberculosis TaxID=1773 RepID=UPI001F21068B
LRSTPETSRRLRSQIRESPDSPGRFTKARWVYFLTRMRNPTGDTAPFQQFANRLHQWFQDPTDAKQLKTALHLYIYRTRKEESE